VQVSRSKSEAHRRAEEQRLQCEADFDQFDRPTFDHIRRWNVKELNRRLAGDTLGDPERRLAESQLAFKEKWRRPAIGAVTILMILLLFTAAWCFTAA
jgi:hypothetical protein